MKNKGLFAFLVGSSFGLITVTTPGCKKPTDDIGSDIGVVDGDINSAFTDSFLINAITQRKPSLRSDRTSLAPFGSYFDPYFGITTSSLYLNFGITNTFPSPTAPVVDSVVLRIRYGSPAFYGDIGKYKGPITVTAYRLLDKLTAQASTAEGYKSDQVFNINFTPVGSGTVVPNPYDSVTVDGISEPAHFRLKLDNSFGYQLLTEDPDVFASTSGFLEAFRGLYLKVSPANTYGDGGFVYLLPPATGSRLTIYFNGNQKADCKVNSDASVWVTHHEHNYTVAAPPFQNMGSSVAGDQTLLIQPLSGTQIKLHIPYIKNFNADKSVGINKAELIFPVDPSFQGTYAPPSQMYLVRFDPDSGKTYSLADDPDAANPGANGGAYNADRKEYKFNVTLHLQSVLAGLVDNDSLVLQPAREQTLANRVALYGTQNMTNRVKLRIYYTKIQ